MYNILILGSGGREHALTWKLSKSPKAGKIYISPGNAGTNQIGENITFNINNIDEIKDVILKHNIKIVVVGSEQFLVDGIHDKITNHIELKDVLVIGPKKEGAILEGSKDFSKNFMIENQIPTAKYFTVQKSNIKDGFLFLESLSPPYVLKANGLAAGKGVLIENNLATAKKQLVSMLEGKFGNAGKKVVIEEFLSGIELSVFVLTDGEHYVILPNSKDYKRIGENDTGLNTGGMGAISPVYFADKKFIQKIENRIIIPTINGLKKSKIDYTGFIFIGLMNVNGNPYVIEYNVRLGDPETEVILARLETDLLELFLHVKEKTLDKVIINIIPQTATTIIMASKGYPESYEKNKEISNLEKVKNSIIFHAGTKEVKGKIFSNGGRVLAITTLGDTLKKSLKNGYKNIQKIHFNNSYYRSDIGKDLL